MNIQSATSQSVSFTPQSCLVVSLYSDDLDALLDSPLIEDSDALKALCARKVLTGKAGEAYLLPTPAAAYGGIGVLGLGERSKSTPEVMRRAAGELASKLKAERLSAVVVYLSVDASVEAALEGLVLGQYDYASFKKKKEDAPSDLSDFTVIVEDAVSADAATAVCEQRLIRCQNVNWTRALADRPPNDLSPAALAECAAEMAKAEGCQCTVLDEHEMRELGMHAILGVSSGSSKPAKLILLHYTHDEAAETVAIVGKGLTFDTGGISIKPSLNMHEMKYDMCGAAAVLGAIRAVCQLKPAINVVCVVPAAENMTGADAQRPGDIVRAYNGKTVEVHNTDAEGRMVLADALAYTIDTYNPSAVVDAATLTGACLVALGHFAAGLMTNDAPLTEGLEQAAEASGDRVWSLPMWDDYARLMEGNHADLCNIGPDSTAGAITAACFLKEFVGDTPWAHLDIAGTAWGVKNVSYLNPKHATGYGVRLLTQWILDRAGAS